MAQQPGKRGAFDASAAQAGQNQSFDMSATGDIDRSEFQDQFETVDTPAWKDVAKLAAFMEEPVEVLILSTDNPNAEHVIQLSVNGTNQFIFRGVNQFIRRKYVEVLCRAKPESVRTEEFIDATGNRATRINKSSGLKYPFSIISDKNPDGPRWVESIMREA